MTRQVRRYRTRMAVGAAVLALAGACTETKVEKQFVQVSAPASTYLVEYLPGMMDATVGKSTFRLRVKKRSDDSPAAGLAVSLRPVMTMSTMTHGAPADVVRESATPGTYDCAVYYLMMSGVGMGYWELNVDIGGETATFYPSVGMYMGTDKPVRRTLWGASDGMGTTDPRYFVFRDGPVSAAAHTVPFFLSRSESMMMAFQPVVSTGFAPGVPVLTASADPSFTTPIAAAHAGDGHWTVDIASLGPVEGTPTTVYLKLIVAGEPKTVDGTPTTAYTSFTVTPVP